jgi:2',3'-cyclic-nucleotide 2'-phosphodiesterase (5'-nucleotidase family)
MRNREAAFNAHQKKMQGIWAAQDANHASFMNRNFGSGSGVAQKQFINMINEEETVYNPSTGMNYQVNAGSTEYWMDSDRNYISNDNLFYNPNGDINLNYKKWTKVKKAY